MTIGELFAALQSGQWATLIGVPEDGQIEFKRAPHHLSTDRQKWELAKDVGALANKAGGAMVVGVETRRHPNEVVDAAIAIHPVTKATVDPDQWRNVIGSWIHPPPRGIQLRWFPNDPATGNGLFVVEIPLQPDHLRPFVIRRTIEEGGNRIEAVGVPRRDGGRVAWESAEEIQRQLADHRRPISETPVAPTAQDSAERADVRITEIVHLQDWAGHPVYQLQALPPPDGGPVRNLYTEVRAAILNPEVLRSNGFALRWRVDTELREGALLVRHREGITWVDRDGLTSEGHLVADNSHLGWFYNQERAEGEALLLHPVALLEVTLEFFRFVDRALKPRLAAEGWRYRIACLDFHRNRIVLPRGRPNSRADAFMIHPALEVASSDNWRRAIADAGSPENNAFQALVEIYALFGLDPGAIPLVENNAVAPTQLAALH